MNDRVKLQIDMMQKQQSIKDSMSYGIFRNKKERDDFMFKKEKPKNNEKPIVVYKAVNKQGFGWLGAAIFLLGGFWLGSLGD